MATDSNTHLDIDTKLLSEFLYALNIARRQVQSYPKGHPMVAKATAGLVEILPRLLEFRNEITMGIARDTLIFEGELIDASNPVYQDLAHNLFEAQIASLTINRDLTESEICKFFEAYQGQDSAVAEAGGLESFLPREGFRGIRVKGVDFSAFSTTELDVVHAPKTKMLESDSALLWKSFADGIVSGTIDPEGQRSLPAEIDPELLAEILNNDSNSNAEVLTGSYEEAITSFLNQSDKEKIQGKVYEDSLGRFGEMIGKLKPKLRRQFLNSMFKNCAKRPGSAEEILGKVPKAALLDAMENIDPGEFEIPQTLLDVMARLAKNREGAASQSRVVGERQRTDEETAAQLTRLFAEDRSEYYVPRDYQDALAAMAGAHDDLLAEPQRVQELKATLATSRAEVQFSAVLTDLLNRDVDDKAVAAIAENLHDMTTYFLELGDFVSVKHIFDCLKKYAEREPERVEGSVSEALDNFSSEEFITTVLDGLDRWDKPLHDSIEALIEGVGLPFASTLLEHLADEPRMARRRLYMKLLIRFGPEVIEHVSPLLIDDRWYFVRNLVVVLREVKTPAVLPLLEGLKGHAHSKVRFEVMKTFLQFEQKDAKKNLHKELASRNPATLVNAVRLAAGSRDHRVNEQLIKLLNRRLPGEYEHEILSIVLKTLHEDPSVKVLPELKRFLLGKGFFAGTRDSELKIRALAVLEKIGTVDAGLLAGEVAQSSHGDLAKAAEEVLTRIHGRLT